MITCFNASPPPAESLTESRLLFERIAHGCRTGCRESRNELASYLHSEFYEIARRLCGGQSFEKSLHATLLLNETFLRLLKTGVFADPKSRRFMFGVAGKTMRNVIADYFRNKRATKRNSGGQRLYLDQLLDQLESSDFEFHELDAAMGELEVLAPRQAEIVNMRFFFGMTMPEISERLQISLSTVEADWRRARAWLFRELS